MSLSPAKCRVEIFREPGFFDDNFVKGWTNISGIKTIDGDKVMIASWNNVAGRIEKDISPNLSAGTYTVIVRVTQIEGNGVWGVKLYFSGYGWYTVWTGQTGVGVFENSFTTSYTITKIALLQEYPGATTDRAHFDYAAVCKNALLVPDLGSLVEELTITRQLVNIGISGAKLSIPNFAGLYNGLIKNNDAIIIWLARDEANLGLLAYKVFGGRVVNPGNSGEKYGAFYINLECHGHAYELNIPPASLEKAYSAANGRTIIEDAVALCNYLAKHPTETMWFDNAGSSGSTDDRINSTHDAVYDEELPLTVIQEILEKAKNPAAVQGFDIYETPAGCLVGHLRDSLDFTSPIASITPESYERSEDWHRVRNKIKVYGKVGRLFPADGDSRTEQNDTETPADDGWVSDGTLTWNTTAPMVGAESVQSFRPSNMAIYLTNSFPAISLLSKNSYRKLKFFIHAYQESGSVYYRALGFIIELRAPDYDNRFQRYFSAYEILAGMLQYFEEFSLDVGLEAESANDEQGWMPVGSPDWRNIQAVCFKVGWNIDEIRNIYVRIDGFHFAEGRFVGVAEDSISQGKYGIRRPKPIVDDNLKTNAECQAKAESILNIVKNPVITFSKVVADGDHRYNPGDRQRIIIANDNFDVYSRIIEVKYSVKEAQWDAILTLNNESQYIDYVFRLLQEAQKRLERK